MLKLNYFKEFQTRAAAIGRPKFFFLFQALFHHEMKKIFERIIECFSVLF